MEENTIMIIDPKTFYFDFVWPKDFDENLKHEIELTDKTKNGEKVPNLEVVEVVLVQCNLVDNQYQQKSEVLYTFTPSKSYAYLLNSEPSNLVFLEMYNTGCDEIIIIFTNQNGRPLEVEDKFNLTLFINK